MTKKFSKRKLSVMLTALLFSVTTMGAMASDITGVTPVNGVFNIDPSSTVNGIGFKDYQNFILDKGETANLKFNGINKFVNMVDNQININGLVRTVDGGGTFTNGHAVFISPKGMVVGSDGVLNVGALSVYTPTVQGMNMLRKGVASGTLTTEYQGKQIDLLEAMGWHGNAPITVDGKVFSAGDVTMVANQFNLGASGGIAAGALMPSNMLFNSLVNTGNAAKIDIRTYERNGGGGFILAGDLRNMGNGNIEVINRGAGGMNVSGDVSANNGQLHLVNAAGAMNVSGTVQGNGDSIYLTNGATGGKMTITGNITGNAGTRIWNRSASGAEIGGKIVNTAKGLAITSEGGELKFTGDIKNTNANINIMNTGSKLILNNIESSGGKMVISSNGADGMELNGVITNAGSTAIANYNGDMKVNGIVENTSGKMNLTNKGTGNLVLADGSQVLSAGEEVIIQNTDGGGLVVEDGALVGSETDALYVQNTGSGGLTVNGTVDNKGSVVLYNRSGDLTVASTGEVRAEDGTLYLSNAGGALNVNEDAQILAKGTGSRLNVLNTGDGGMNLDGTFIHSTGQTLITNRNGDLNVNGLIDNSGGRLYLNNSGSGALNISATGELSNGGLGRTYITNKGAGGMNIEGTVAGGGHIIATNRAGGMNISSKVTSTKSNVVLTNTGTEDMVISGTVRGNKVTAYSKGNDIVLGNTETNQIAINGLKKVSITTDDGSIKNAGVDTHLIKSGGNLYMAANNGTIGEDVDTSGIGAESRDLTKSINVYVNGRVKAFTTDKNKNSVINIASKGKDLNVDRIKADGKVILLTDKYTDENGVVHTGSILNAATELEDYANVKGTSIQIMSSGSVGTADNALHIRQTDVNQKSNIVAVKDVYLHGRGENDEKVNFGTIKSKEGSIEADLIKDGIIDNAIAPGKIDITSRRNEANLNIKNTSNNPNVIKDYFDE